MLIVRSCEQLERLFVREEDLAPVVPPVLGRKSKPASFVSSVQERLGRSFVSCQAGQACRFHDAHVADVDAVPFANNRRRTSQGTIFFVLETSQNDDRLQ